MFTNTTTLLGSVEESFSELWVGNILLFILIVVTVVLSIVGIVLGTRSKHIERVQQEYAHLLKPGAVKLEYSNGELKYSHHDDQDWGDFFGEVKRQNKYRKYEVGGLFGKVKKAAKNYSSLDEEFTKEVASSFNNEFNKCGLDCITWDGKGKLPSDDYVKPHAIPQCIDYMYHFILRGGDRSSSIVEEKDSEGRYSLLCSGPGAIAKTKEVSPRDRIKNLIFSILDNEKIIELIKNRDKAKEDVGKALKEYNDKLSEVIRDLRMSPRSRVKR